MNEVSWGTRAYGLFVICGVAVAALPAQTVTTLHEFHDTDGAYPTAAPFQATDGYLYGTTESGGAGSNGTVFKIAPTGALTTLYDFCVQSGCLDGGAPTAGVIQASDGNLYGTTHSGGVGYGTAFRITPDGILKTLYTFCSEDNCANGAEPFAPLVQASDGNFYGTAALGGHHFAGTVFRLTPGGTLTGIYSLCSEAGCTDGQYPTAGLIQATDGNLYGTTAYGANFGSGGTVFKITLEGTLTTLHSFCSQAGCADGEYPNALVQGRDGNFYGTTSGAGLNRGGTVFRITPSGVLTTLYNFCSQSGCLDGEQPDSGLIQATDGNFYGTTVFGGAIGTGTAFEITPGGILTTLHSFCSQSACSDGYAPQGGLVQDTNGSFYGTASQGGLPYSLGTVFQMFLGLGPFIAVRPSGGKVGEAVKILGTNLTGAASVTFNGTPAAFTVVSSSEITSNVPAGATTGKVRVVVSNLTLSSNINFRVTP